MKMHTNFFHSEQANSTKEFVLPEKPKKHSLCGRAQLIWILFLSCFFSWTLNAESFASLDIEVNIEEWTFADKFAGYKVDYALITDFGSAGAAGLNHGCHADFYLEFDFLNGSGETIYSTTVQDENEDSEGFYSVYGPYNESPFPQPFMGSQKQSDYISLPCQNMEDIAELSVKLIHQNESNTCQDLYNIQYTVIYPDGTSSISNTNGSHAYTNDLIGIYGDNIGSQDGALAYTLFPVVVNENDTDLYSDGLAIVQVNEVWSPQENSGEQLYTIDVVGGCPPYSIEWSSNTVAVIPNYAEMDCFPFGGYYDSNSDDFLVNGVVSVPLGHEYEVEVTDSDGNSVVQTVSVESPYSLNVTAAETWNSDMVISNLITVKDGAVLTIDGAELSFRGQESGIAVEKGGILKVVNGATLQGMNCNDRVWRGISVEGNWDVPHPDIDFSTVTSGANPDHALVIVNESTIKDALVGINAYDLSDVVGANIGGGIVVAANSTFINNAIGIQLDRFYAEGEEVQKSLIVNNEFQNNDSPADVGYIAGTKYRQVVLNRCQGVEVTGNLFKASSSLLGKERGIGLIAYNTDATIGEESGSYSNTFDNLFVGVDIYNTLSIISVTNVVNNEFKGVDRGLTLNSLPFSQVRLNKFDVPAPSISSDTYGCLAIESPGFEISLNEFVTSVNDQENKGLVVIASGADEMSQISDNSFDGNFTAATQFESDNSGLDLFCNAYTNGPQNDWYLAPGTTLKDQGICLEDDMNLAFSNHWHSESGGLKKHINNSSGNIFNIFHDYGSAPDLTFSIGITAENVTDCSFGDSGFTRNCQIVYPPLALDTHDCAEDISKKIRVLLKSGDKAGIIELLECVDDHWANKILVGTFTDKRDFTRALATLDKIPDSPQENADFKAVYYAYIQLLSGGTGKQVGEAIELAQDISKDTQSRSQILAQSQFACIQGNTHERSSAKIGGSESVSQNQQVFSAYPNPATNTFSIEFIQDLELNENSVLTLFDLKGQQLKEWRIEDNSNQVFEINDISTGIYFCRITGSKIPVKLIVIN